MAASADMSLGARGTATPRGTRERLRPCAPSSTPINISTAKRRAAAPRVAALYEEGKLTLTLSLKVTLTPQG